MKRTTLQRSGLMVATLAAAGWIWAGAAHAQVGGAGAAGQVGGGQVGTGQVGTGQIGTGQIGAGVQQPRDLAPLSGAQPGVGIGPGGGTQPGVTTQPGVVGTGTQPGISQRGTAVGTQPGTQPGVIQQPQLRTGSVPQQRSAQLFSPNQTTTQIQQQPGLSPQRRYEHGLGVGGEYGAQTGFEQQRGPADDFQRDRMAQREQFDAQYPYDRGVADEFDETTMPPERDTAEDWRYRWWNGRWWYWLPEGQWVYWDGAQWREPARTVGYRYSTTGPRWTGYAGQTSYYWGDPYAYGRGWASPWHRGWGYGWGTPGWGTGYYGGWGTGYRTGWGRGWDRGWDGWGRGGIYGPGVGVGRGIGVGRGGLWFGF